MGDEIRLLHGTIQRLELMWVNEFDFLKKEEIQRFIEAFKTVLSEKSDGLASYEERRSAMAFR